MKIKLTLVLVGIPFFFLLNGNTLAEEAFLSQHIKIGREIYEQSFGRGCGACHEISSNPQLAELISEGALNKYKFSQRTIYATAGGAPSAARAIMVTSAARESGYTLLQAVDAIYTYLEFIGNSEAIENNVKVTIPSVLDQPYAIILNRDFSFNIPRVEFRDPNVNNGNSRFYNVDFSFVPRDTKLVFEAKNIFECNFIASQCFRDEENAIFLNQDFSFNIPIVKYLDSNNVEHFYNVDFSFVPRDNKLVFVVTKVTEIQ